jgi:hypothetical protein
VPRCVRLAAVQGPSVRNPYAGQRIQPEPLFALHRGDPDPRLAAGAERHAEENHLTVRAVLQIVKTIVDRSRVSLKTVATSAWPDARRSSSGQAATTMPSALSTVLNTLVWAAWSAALRRAGVAPHRQHLLIRRGQRGVDSRGAGLADHPEHGPPASGVLAGLVDR